MCPFRVCPTRTLPGMRVVENMRSYCHMHIGTVLRIIMGLSVSLSSEVLKSRIAEHRYAARDA